jgi:twinkle protein
MIAACAMRAISRCQLRLPRAPTLCGCGNIAAASRSDQERVHTSAGSQRCYARRSFSTRPANSISTGSAPGSGTTFVSRHVQLPLAEITDWLKYRELEHRVQGGEVNLKQCPFCHPTGGKIDNLWKLYLGAGAAGGAYYCHRCAAQGSWYDFRRKVAGVEFSTPQAILRAAAAPSSAAARTAHQHSQQQHQHEHQHSNAPPLPNQRVVRAYPAQLMHTASKAAVRDYLMGMGPGQRGLSRLVLQKYGVGSATYSFPVDGGYQEAQCVTFPWMALRSEMSSEEFSALLAGREVPTSRRSATAVTATTAATAATTDVYDAAEQQQQPLPADSVITRVKVRAVSNKGWQRLDPPGGRWGLFGWHTVPPEATEIVLTEGEFDAMAVHQATGMAAVSLPNGCRNLPVDVLPMLERFDKVYLWMDADGPGQEGAAKFAKKLGERRVAVVRPLRDDLSPAKDANEALLAGKDLQAMLDAAAPLPHEDILLFRGTQ